MTVVPDFVSTAGYLVGGFLDGDDQEVAETLHRQVKELLDEAASHPDGVLLGACYRAEAFLETWQPSKPFGRPLAA